MNLDFSKMSKEEILNYLYIFAGLIIGLIIGWFIWS